MKSWWIVVAKKSLENSHEFKREDMLSDWETDLNGLKWIDNLLKNGLAHQVLQGGYPNRYISQAKHVFPLITPVLPHHIGRMHISHSQIAACPLSQNLIIEVWDRF